MMLFSQSDAGNTSLSVGCLPEGPSMTFRVGQYSLSSGVRILQKSPVNTKTIFHTPPLVILNNFDEKTLERPEMKLIQSTFQNMFPPINIATVKLAHCKRVLLYNYDKSKDQIEFRHYAITARPAGLTRSIRKLIQAKIPNLSDTKDISELVFGNSTMGPASDSEYEDEDNQVVLPDRYTGRGNIRNNQSAIKLAELGPRMTLQLVKVMQGLFKGEVMYHAFVSKTEQEKEDLRRKAEQRKQRRLVQEANVKRKREEEEAKAEAKREKRRKRKEQFEAEKRNLVEAGEDALD
jgi:ribosome biogenesis protein SSF1/2